MRLISTMTIGVLLLGYATSPTSAVAEPPKRGHHDEPAKPHHEQKPPEIHKPTGHLAATHPNAKKEEHKKTAEHKHEHSAQEKKILETLGKVTENLHHADHDYDNQRHEAVMHVRAAIHELKGPEPPMSAKFGGMTQAKSDQILRESLPVLKTVRAELSAKGAPAHHEAAVKKLDEAIGKIHVALKVR